MSAIEPVLEHQDGEPVVEPCAVCGQVHEAGCGGHVEECPACGEHEGQFVGVPCTSCGVDEIRLRPCRKPPVNGAKVCLAHGAKAPQVRAAAVRQLEQRRLQSELGRALAGLEEEAAERGIEAVLLDQVWRASAVARFLAAEAGELQGERGSDLRLWTDTAARLSKLALDAGYEQRRIELAEDQARLLVDVMREFARSRMSAFEDVLTRVAPEAAVVELRRLEELAPGEWRSAIERAHVIDVPETKGGQ